MTLPLFVGLVAITLISSWYAGAAMDWFVSSPYCMPMLRRLVFTFLAAAWFRAAYEIATRVLN